MKYFDSKDIIWEDYNEVSAEKYIMYYEQDTMMIRWRAYEPHYFVRKDAVATKLKMVEDLEKQLSLAKNRIQCLLALKEPSAEVMRQEIEKIFVLRDKYKLAFSPELDDLIKSLIPFKEKLNGNKL